ncbi:diaminopimelate decarboxylase family protein [Mycobacterium conspicuum]|uniref:Diaminopimelate decarboxylase n=1 Tax=Mycobacterium conspicuum TaxID=44010 RepID=A0A1X1SWD7_9MYCO|nr:diaminopimelate decarboxylase [Mycobacterium conspicuum]ORV35212.1 diaminopimelate decarboxylase [Mycobacterium conspicuum]BBZ42065.1 diaminopimelate decarboxylase [Mycobacterium conspicuum]
MTLCALHPPSRHGLNSPLDRTIWPLSTTIDERGRLCVGGVPATDVAAEFGTPTHVVDEEDFRSRIRQYRAALPDVELAYAGMALLSTAVAGWAASEGAGVAVCTGGELVTALAGGMSASRIILHGNAKTAGELHDAARAGVGRVVIDSPSEIALLAARLRRRQRVLVRVIPDVGAESAEFGFALAGGQAVGAVKRVLDQPCLDLVGLHCQLGSQLAEPGLYGEAIRQLIAAMAEVRERHQIVLTELNLGGGHPGESKPELRRLATIIDGGLRAACAEYSYPRPGVVIEPGRAIAARAGVTLYRVIAVKRRPDGGSLVAVDGTIADSAAPGGAKYTVALANRHRHSRTAPIVVVGRHGDELACDVELPDDIRPGDLLAMACTGAYHHSMGRSCNLEGRPPLVAVAGGQCQELVRRETVADLLGRDRGWPGHTVTSAAS